MPMQDKATARPWTGWSAPAAILAIWFAGIVALAAADAFAGAPTQPPLGIFLAIVLPPLLFALLYRLSGRVRAFALAIDLRWLTAIQGWRVIGGMFLVLYVFGLLLGLLADGAPHADLGELPLSIVPTFAVPLWTIFHMISLLQLRRARSMNI
jgi:hypothetical protein